MENTYDYLTFNNMIYCGTYEDYMVSLKNLSELADEEQWTYNPENPYGILKSYLNGTIRQCKSQNKFLVTADKKYSCFNTGLLTPNGNDIIALLKDNSKYKATNPEAQDWILKSFVDNTDRFFMKLFSTIPALVTYTENYTDFNFNPDLKLIINSDHILDDNWDRISSVVPLPKTLVKTLVIGAVEEIKKKIKRNTRLAVPQFYNNQVMYLLPIVLPIDDNNSVTMALAIERTENNQYRANTIFTKEMAYEKARLLMKPESNWLI